MPDNEARTIKRREEDQCRVSHCNIHDDTIEHIRDSAQRTKDTATEMHSIAMKVEKQDATYTTLKWVVGTCLPLLLMMLSAFYASYLKSSDNLSSHQDRISANVEAVKTLVQTGMIDSATDRATTKNRLDNIETDINDLKRKVDGGRR